MRVLGLDIGGANLKAATSDGQAVTLPFPLWRQSDTLTDAIRALCEQLKPIDTVTVVMTGELADCYSSKVDGVRAIIRAVEAVSGQVPVWYWHTGGEFLTADEAFELPEMVAAANWHALATVCARAVPSGVGLLCDIGSTTTDFIPIENGAVAAIGTSDPARLRTGELVYLGSTRTPLCAFGPTVTVAGQDYSVAAEFFATIKDVHLLLGNLSEEPSDCDTADGRPATKSDAARRLSRMLCGDPHEFADGFLQKLAEQFIVAQNRLLRNGLHKVLSQISPPNIVIVSGSGAFALQSVLREEKALSGSEFLHLAELWGSSNSAAACAHAVAKLGMERLHDFGGRTLRG